MSRNARSNRLRNGNAHNQANESQSSLVKSRNAQSVSINTQRQFRKLNDCDDELGLIPEIDESTIKNNKSRNARGSSSEKPKKLVRFDDRITI